MNDLPIGWVNTILDNVLLTIVGGGTPSRNNLSYFSGDIPWFTVKDMKCLRPSNAEEHITDTAISNSATNLIPANTLIIATRIALGRAIRPSVRCAINQDLKALFPGIGVNPDFLLYWVSAHERVIQDLGSGTTVSGIRLEALRSLHILLPPSAEQSRIVEKLEELLSDLDAGVAELKAAQKKLVQYRQSLLKAAVEGKLTEQWRNNRYAASPQYLTDRARDATANDTATNTPLSPRGRGVGGEGATTSGLPHSAWLRDRARELRKAQTPQEQALWQQLRAKRFSGFKFRRQQVIGRYIADFVCFEQKLVIELDGSQHRDTKQADAQRDHWLNGQGFRVLRFWNNQWQSQQTGVLEAIWQALHEDKPSPPLPNPSPTRGEGLSVTPDVDENGRSGSQPDASFYHDERGAGEAVESGAQLLERIRKERRARWEAKQLDKFQEQGKDPPKGWQDKYPEPVKPDTRDLPKLPEGWVWASLSQVGWLDRGKSKHRPRNAAHLYGGPYPFVQTGDIRHSDTFIYSVEATYSEAGLAQSKLWPSGTMCITIAANIGKTAILGMEACFPDSVVGFLSGTNEISIRYIEYFMRSVQQKLEDEAPATAQKNINLEILGKVVLPLPPIKEQDYIVERLDVLFNAAKDKNHSIDLALKQSDAQRKNILKAAFSGQLVPQDPDDEPASVLLERIRAERAAKQTVKTPKNRTTRSTS